MSPWVHEPRLAPFLQESGGHMLGLLPLSTSVCLGTMAMVPHEWLGGGEGGRKNHNVLTEGAGPGLGWQGMFVQL